MSLREAQPGCPYKSGTQTFSWVRVTALGSGERQLWVAQRQRMGVPHATTHCPSKGAGLAVQSSPKESPASLVVS